MVRFLNSSESWGFKIGNGEMARVAGLTPCYHDPATVKRTVSLLYYIKYGNIRHFSLH